MRATTRFSLVVLLMLGMSSIGWAQSNSALLEKGIYAEETLGNLSDAIKIYLQIMSNTDTARPIAAQALYRLGVCYLKSGKQAEAQATFSKLAKLYPEQKELIAGIPTSAISSELQLRPAPWQDGEVLEFVEKTKGSEVSGLQVLRVEAAEEYGRKAWHLDWLAAPGNGAELIRGGIGNVMIKSVVADAYSLAPLRSNIVGRGVDAHATFLAGQVQIQPSKTGTPGHIPLTKMAYDDSQILQFLRCLPFGVGLQITVPLFNILDGAVTEARVSVEGREKIGVPAGTFDCYRVLISRGPRGVANEQTIWITADAHAYIAKASFSEDYKIELASVHWALKDGDYEVDYPTWGFKLWIPAGWVIYSMPHEDYPKLYNNFAIVSPELTAECYLSVFTSDVRDPRSPEVVDWLEQSQRLRAQNLRRYAIRGEREIIQISGFPAVRAIGDFRRRELGNDYRDRETDDEVVDYYVAFYTGTRKVELTMQAGKKVFEDMRPVFDSIVKGLRFK